MPRPEPPDYIVIGAGSAGCVVAARLTENPDISVWLMEAGPPGDMLLDIPGALLRSSTIAKYNWGFQTEPQAELLARSLFWSQGRVFGGSGAINGMVYTRGTPRDFDDWASAGCPGWNFEQVLPFFRKSETNERGASHWHGDSGPLAVTRGNPQTGILDRFLGAANNRGHQILDDFNAGDPTGFGHYDRTIGGGVRNSTARAFLGKPNRPGNLRCFTGVLVERLIIENGAAVGIAFRDGGSLKTVRAQREIIVCAGALKSPQLLMLSGIGPADHLRSLDIEVVADVPTVGEGLCTHLLFPMSYVCSEPITAYRHATPTGAMRAAIQYAVAKRGILAQTPVASGGFLKTDSGLATPDVQVQAMIGLAGQVGQTLWSRLPKRHGFSLMINQSRPQSRGRVSLQSVDPGAPPLIAAKLLSAPEDMRVVLAGIDRVRDILADGAISRIITPLGDVGTASAAETASMVRERAYLAFHGTGTCRMGSDPEAVVDTELRVRAVKNLRVADPSVIPVMLSANMNAPAIMIGERCADFIRSPSSSQGRTHEFRLSC